MLACLSQPVSSTTRPRSAPMRDDLATDRRPDRLLAPRTVTDELLQNLRIHSQSLPIGSMDLRCPAFSSPWTRKRTAAVRPLATTQLLITGLRNPAVIALR